MRKTIKSITQITCLPFNYLFKYSWPTVVVVVVGPFRAMFCRQCVAFKKKINDKRMRCVCIRMEMHARACTRTRTQKHIQALRCAKTENSIHKFSVAVNIEIERKRKGKTRHAMQCDARNQRLNYSRRNKFRSVISVSYSVDSRRRCRGSRREKPATLPLSVPPFENNSRNAKMKQETSTRRAMQSFCGSLS